MEKISNREIIDVIRYTADKIIIVEKLPDLDLSGYRTNYFILDLNSLEKEVITKNAYLMKKFGSAYQEITSRISSYAQCEAAILRDRSVFVIFPNGQCGRFDSEGEIIWNDRLTYNDKPVSSLALDGDYIWCCCKDENCVIRYSLEKKPILDIRIGDLTAKTFILPSFVSADDENVYVCCNDIKLRSINKKDFTVSDIGSAVSGLRRFYRFGRKSLVCTADGAYIE